jgi:phosphoribosylformylglycinamidine cyclo-ligase
VAQEHLESTLNCGVGMVALLPADEAAQAVGVLDGHGIRAWVAGEVTADGEGGGRVSLVGRHPGW